MRFLGTSPKTSIFGYLIMGLTVANELITEGGLPTDAAGWTRFGIGIATGVAVRLSKDEDMSNAPHPGDAQKVDSR